VNDIHVFHNPSEARVMAVKVGCVIAAVADEELGTACIPSSVCHGKNAPVMVLVAAIQLALDGVSRTARTGAGRVTALDHEVRYHPVKRHPVIEAGFRKLKEVSYSSWCIGVIKMDCHVAFFGLNDCFAHVFLNWSQR